MHTMDGGDTAGGLPDGAHINNANFNTPPDGTLADHADVPQPGTRYIAASSSDAFDNIGHEFTHGLSNRLVVDSMGNSTLNSYQGGAMGEGWSDFYSFDYLLSHQLVTNDRGKSGELMYDRYLSQEPRLHPQPRPSTARSASTRRLCKQIDGVGVGGYTLRRHRRPARPPRCTPPARSGPRRCGTSTSGSATRSRCAWSPPR